MKLTIANDEALIQWMRERYTHDLSSIKGPAPEGATYSDGDRIVRDVNIAWRDEQTGEVFNIEYVRHSGQGEKK